MNCSSSARNRGNGKFTATSLPPPILPRPNNACFPRGLSGPLDQTLTSPRRIPPQPITTEFRPISSPLHGHYPNPTFGNLVELCDRGAVFVEHPALAVCCRRQCRRQGETVIALKGRNRKCTLYYDQTLVTSHLGARVRSSCRFSFGYRSN